MKPFEYAKPETEADAVVLLSEFEGLSMVLAGGTDLLSLMRESGVSPGRIVDIKGIPSIQGILEQDEYIVIGAATTLEALANEPLLKPLHALQDAIADIRAIQIQQNGTLGGDLCIYPNCWYFRNGYGLLGLTAKTDDPPTGDNRYHAILGNSGPARFVCASRLAPTLIAMNAEVRIAGSMPDASRWVPLSQLFESPSKPGDKPHNLKHGEFVTHVRYLQAAATNRTANYDVLQLEGLDWPLASAACSLTIEDGVVAEANIVLGHVAPTPWPVSDAAKSLIGERPEEKAIAAAAKLAVKNATPLPDNAWRVPLAEVAVERSLKRAVGRD